jgi:S1-C subfamily serine protease
MIHTKCPSCDRGYEFADSLAGFAIVCKSCHFHFTVPSLNRADPGRTDKPGSERPAEAAPGGRDAGGAGGPAAAAPAAGKSGLAERLAFLKDTSAEPSRPGAEGKGPQQQTPGVSRRWLWAGLGLAFLAVSVTAAVWLVSRPGNEGPSKGRSANKRRDLPPGPAEAEKSPPPEDRQSPAGLPPEAIYQRVMKATAWVYDWQEMAGSEWAGTQDLADAASLRLLFLPSSRVLRLSADARTLGTWGMKGAEVTLRFSSADVRVVYSGAVNGRIMAGTATDGTETWKWRVKRKAAPDGIGSGALVDARHRLLVTNLHVVRDSRSVLLHFPAFVNGEALKKRQDYRDRPGTVGRVVLKEPRSDLALVRLDRLPDGARPIPLAPRSVRTAQAVHSVGNMGWSGALWVYSHGQVRQVYEKEWKTHDELTGRDLNFAAKVVETDTPLNPGDSGGPLVDGRARLVGIAHGTHARAKNLSVFIDVEECRALLRRYYESVGEAAPE